MAPLKIFFFKQKTAYEMRISDWSSDVCSSDLTSTPTVTPSSSPPPSAQPPHAPPILAPASQSGAPTGLKKSNVEKKASLSWTIEIGRGSCRERVCQSV